MRSARTRAAAIIAVLAMTAVPMAGPAWAAAPLNDEPAGAVPLTLEVPYTMDTTEATTSTDEAALNDMYCGAPAFDHAVWFSFTPAEDGLFSFDVQKARFAAGVLLPVTADGSNCGPGRVLASLMAGETYEIVVFGDGTAPETYGELTIIAAPAIPAPDIAVTIDRRGIVDKAGGVTLSGTVTCTSEVGGIVVDMYGELRQRVGRFYVTGYFGASFGVRCDGTPQPWSAYVTPENGLFAGGKAANVTYTYGCTDFCSEQYNEATVQLSKGGGKR